MSAFIIGVLFLWCFIDYWVYCERKKKNIFQERIRFGNLTTRRYFINTRALILSLQLNTGAIFFFCFIFCDKSHTAQAYRQKGSSSHTHTHTGMSKLSLYVQVFFSLPLFLSVFEALVCVFLCPYMLTVRESEKKKGEVSRLANIKHRAKKEGCVKKQLIDKKKKKREERKNPLTKQRCVLLQIAVDARLSAALSIINQGGRIERETAKGLFVAGVNNKTSKQTKKKSPTNIFFSGVVLLPRSVFFSFFFFF